MKILVGDNGNIDFDGPFNVTDKQAERIIDFFKKIGNFFNCFDVRVDSRNYRDTSDNPITSYYGMDLGEIRKYFLIRNECEFLMLIWINMFNIKKKEIHQLNKFFNKIFRKESASF